MCRRGEAAAPIEGRPDPSIEGRPDPSETARKPDPSEEAEGNPTEEDRKKEQQAGKIQVRRRSSFEGRNVEGRNSRQSKEEPLPSVTVRRSIPHSKEPTINHRCDPPNNQTLEKKEKEAKVVQDERKKQNGMTTTENRKSLWNPFNNQRNWEIITATYRNDTPIKQAKGKKQRMRQTSDRKREKGTMVP